MREKVFLRNALYQISMALLQAQKLTAGGGDSAAECYGERSKGRARQSPKRRIPGCGTRVKNNVLESIFLKSL